MPNLSSLLRLGLLSVGLLALSLPLHVKAADTGGALISNGDFETAAKGKDWPDGWPHLKTGGSWEFEQGNHFLRLKSTEPGKMVMLFRPVAIPPGTKALQLSWRWRVADLKVGKLPWNTACVMVALLDASGQKISPQPGPAHAKDTNGAWQEKTMSFLVPPGAVTLNLMPCLFQVTQGTLDIDDFALQAIDPGQLEAAAKLRAQEAAARYVPPEQPDKSKWPAELHVQGNRLVDPAGKEAWLQGVNVGGLETLPFDKQVIKSTVVAIDEWKANCLRLPVNEAYWFGRGNPGKGMVQTDGGKAYRETIDEIVTLAANRGAYVVLDLHRFRAPKPEHVEFWKDAAAHFKDNPAVLFDLFNEPHDISWQVWRDGGWVGNPKKPDESAFLTDAEKKANEGFQSVGMQALVDAVRSTGAKNIVIAGGLAWSGDLSGVSDGYALSDKTGDGVMYSWHQYNWHKGWAREVLPAAAKYPIFLGEVGADIQKMDFIPKDIQEDPYTWAPDMLGFIQKYRLNWTAWCLHPHAAPRLILDWSYTPTPFWGVFVKEALAGKQFEMKRMR